MAIPKVVGIETEYGILVKGGESNPVLASSVLINAYVAATSPRICWDFDDERPSSDARGFSLDGGPDVEMHLVNSVLTNGARYYVDHAHPEISTPECRGIREAVVYDRAAEEIVRRSMEYSRSVLADDVELLLYKNNSDGKGNSYGCHENYLIDRGVPFGRLVADITPHFVTRQVFTGAGKVGSEEPGTSAADVPFQISQRADFFEEEVGLETTLKRPIVNTRDEPHCDPVKYRRLHVIVGDANMSEVATYLKLGTTAIVLTMIEDDTFPSDLALANPVPAIRIVSHDPSLTRTIGLRDGRRMTALDVQWSILEAARRHQKKRGFDSVEDADDVLNRWEQVLAGLASDRSTVADVVDWVAKERVVRAYADRHSIEGYDVRLKALDLQYHDMRPEKCIASRLGLRTIVGADEVRTAMTEPPDTTRAYFRGRLLAKWPQSVVAANWDSVVLDVGRDPLRRVPMMEPLRGTRELVGSLIDSSDSVVELVTRLGAAPEM
ncbi:MAG: proteasome accessory factor PafA2 [Actinobacteria bacterium]|nr:proteasome accessory factor PafA2 [Actinomycetota bacterium]